MAIRGETREIDPKARPGLSRQGSFHRAAEKLFVSQPALTITINQLEDLVGVSLFNRTTRRVDLTIDGEDFLPIAERLIADFDRAISDLKASAERRGGQMAIAVLPSLTINLIPELLARFKNTTLGNGSSKGPLAWRKLKGFPFAGMSRDTGVHKLINTVEGRPETIRYPEYEVLTMVALGGILQAKLAITVLPLLAVPSYMHPALVFRELIDSRVEREFCVITRRPYPLSAAAQRVRDMLLTETPRYVE